MKISTSEQQRASLFLQIPSSFCLLVYIPLIEFKVTLEMLTPKVKKKTTEIYTIASDKHFILNTKYRFLPLVITI